MSKHLIHRQVLDFHYSDERKAKAAMGQWGERFQTEWVPILEEVLDELDQKGKWYRLEKVELDLGNIQEKIEPEVLRGKLKEALKTQLLRQIPELREQNKEPKIDDSRQPNDESKPLELLIYLLQFGRRPWWASNSKKEGIKDLIKQLVSDKSKPFLVWLQSESFIEEMVDRLINHIEPDEIQKMLSLAFPKKRKETQSLVNALIATLSPEITPKSELKKFLTKQIAGAFFIPENQLEHPVSSWFKIWLFKPKTGFHPPYEAFWELLAWLIPADFLQKSKTKILENVWFKWTQTSTYQNPLDSKIRRTISTSGGKENFLEFLKNKRAIQKLSRKKELQKRQIRSASSEKLELDETFPISNSGLVLAAPFLPYFFKGLGLVENKEFVSPEAQNRGVLLIQALLDDSYFYEESDLLLNKILCGIDPSQPIEVNFSPTDREKEEIQNLLDSMVARWTALKSTSGTSMARGFFPREGSLKRLDKGYQLAIPRISIDILLNRLPWTIGIIKLPWMIETLYTEW